MSLLTEIFGVDAINWSLDHLTEEIKQLPPHLKERASYLLKDWAIINGYQLTKEDYRKVS